MKRATCGGPARGRRAWIRGAAVAAGLMSATPAEALETYMWGVGPRVGTHAIPGRYPMALPPAVREDGAIERVRDDIILGVEAVYYMNAGSRIGVLGGVDLGRRFSDVHFIAKYDLVRAAEAVDLLLGGGAGFGKTVFRGEGESRLVIPNYPLRGHASVQLRDGSRAYQATLFAEYNLPANHFYWNVAGEEVDVGTGFYLTFGLELTLMFGDFTPPRPQRR